MLVGNSKHKYHLCTLGRRKRRLRGLGKDAKSSAWGYSSCRRQDVTRLVYGGAAWSEVRPDLQQMPVTGWHVACLRAPGPAKPQAVVRQGCQRCRRSPATQNGSAAMVTQPAPPDCLQARRDPQRGSFPTAVRPPAHPPAFALAHVLYKQPAHWNIRKTW